MKRIRVILAAACFAAGCGDKNATRPATLLPDTGEAPGWTRTGEVRTFGADRLWEYINGDAERYTRAGVERTLTADYRFRGGMEAVADVHIMRTPDGARTIMESEPAAGSVAIGIGDAARSYGTSLIFRKNRFLVRLVAHTQTPEAASALTELGKAIEERVAAMDASKGEAGR